MQKNNFSWEDFEEMTLEEARERLADVLKRFGLEKMASVEMIEEWIRNSGTEGSVARNPADVLHISAGLGRNLEKEEYEEYIDVLVPCIETLNNHLPHTSIGNKSPKQALAESERDLVFDVNVEIDSGAQIDRFSKSVKAMKYGDFKQTKAFLDNGFSKCLEGRTIFPDVYRPFGNLAAYYVMRGKAECAKIAARWALDLNPRYDFAQKMLHRAESMDLEDALSGLEMRENMESLESIKKLGERVGKMKTVKEVLHALESFGVTLDIDQWLRDVRKKKSTASVKEKYMDMPYLAHCKKIGEEPKAFYDGFFLDVSDRLWELLRRKDERVFEDCVQSVHRMDEGFDDDGVPDLKTAEKFFFEMDMCLNGESGDAIVREMRKYKGDCDELFRVLLELCTYPEWRKDALRVMRIWSEALPKNQLFLLTPVLVLLFEKKTWRTEFDRLVSKDPYGISFHSDMAYTLQYAEKDFTSARDILSEALERVRRCDKEKRYDANIGTLYDSYTSVIEDLADVYELLRDKEGKKSMERFLKEIEARKEELVFSPREEHFHGALREVESEMATKEMKQTSAKKYYDFLKKTGISFATEELTRDKITVRRVNGEKIGRNDPCICGSGKKYKKCCLK